MKKYLLLVLALVSVVALGSCKKGVTWLEIYVNDSATIAVPAATPVGTTLVALAPVAVSSTNATAYAKYRTTGAYVEDASVRQLTLTATGPTGQTFNFLKRIEVYISTDATGSDKVLLGSLDAVPAGATTLTLTPGGSDLGPYLHSSTYVLTTNVLLNSAVPQEVALRADVRYFVKANLPKN